jgi:hypothetical protein
MLRVAMYCLRAINQGMERRAALEPAEPALHIAQQEKCVMLPCLGYFETEALKPSHNIQSKKCQCGESLDNHICPTGLFRFK